MTGNGLAPQGNFAIVTMSDVAPQSVSWHWKGRIPLGKLVTLDGDPGVGKSTLALTFAAMVSTGGIWPDRTNCEYPSDVILMSAEDGLADTIRPRLDAAGADVTRIHAVQGVPLSEQEPDVMRMPTLGDIAQLRNRINATGARLVIIDVLMAYIPTGVDSHRDQDVRQILARLSALAESTGCTILLLRHLNKGKGDALWPRRRLYRHRGRGTRRHVGCHRPRRRRSASACATEEQPRRRAASADVPAGA
jgi:putative DNA primase/helicase